MNDLKPFTHGQEGTHYACDEALQEGNGCRGCLDHKCIENRECPMKGRMSQCSNEERCIHKSVQEFADTLKDNPKEIIAWAKREIAEYQSLIEILEKRLY